MKIHLHKVGKRYRKWVISNCTLTLEGPRLVGIAGANGSGKSTLLKMISGYLSPSKGQIGFETNDGVSILEDELHKQLNFYAPYGFGIDEFSLEEHVRFHTAFKKLSLNGGEDELFDKANLVAHRSERLGNLSSGMYQRFLLALTIFSQGDLYLFDEPCSFLDVDAQAWFHKMVELHLSEKLVIVASNQTAVLQPCTKIVDVEEFSPNS